MTLINVRQETSSHWYTRQGKPFHEIECVSKPGQMRPVDVRDARKLGLLPSVTNVLSVLAKKNLERWKIEQAILAALTLPKLDSETDDHFAARVIQDSEAESRRAMDFGTRLHSAIEFYLTASIVEAEQGMAEFIDLFVSWWEAHATELTGHVVDFKTQGREIGPLVFYDEWAWQLAAYQDALSGMATTGVVSEIVVVSPRGYGGRVDYVHDDGGRLGCASIAISSKTPGLIEMKKWTADEVEEGRRIFLAALELWQLMKRYDSRKEPDDGNNVDKGSRSGARRGACGLQANRKKRVQQL